MHTTYKLSELQTEDAAFYARLREIAIQSASVNDLEVSANRQVEGVFIKFPEDLVQKALLGFRPTDIKRIRIGRYVEDKREYIGIDVHFSDGLPALFNYPWLRLGFPRDNPDYVTIRAGTGISIVHDGGLLGIPLSLEDYKRIERHPRYLHVAHIIGSYRDTGDLQLTPTHLPIMHSDRVTWKDPRIEVIPATAMHYVWQNLQRIRV